jgi:hypothetical protein
MRMLILSAALLAAPAWAAPEPLRWAEIGRDAAGRPVEIARGSLTWRNLQRAWWRIAYAEPRTDGAIEERHLELIDCNDQTSAIIRTMTVGPDGQTLAEQVDGENLAMQRLSPPTPKTTGEMVAMAACRLRPPPPKRR